MRAHLEHDGDVTAERLYDLAIWQTDPSRFDRAAKRLREASWRRRGRKAPPVRGTEPLE